MTLLKWLCKIWSYEKAFSKAQEDGQIPDDEPFLYFSVISEGLEQPITFPYDLSLPSRSYMHKLHESGKTKSATARITTYEDRDRICAEAYFRLTDDWAVIGEASIKQFRFKGISPSEVVEELATIALTDNIKMVLKGEKNATTTKDVGERMVVVESLSKASFGYVHTNGEVWD